MKEGIVVWRLPFAESTILLESAVRAVLAQDSPPIITLESIINVATGAGFGALAWYLISKVLPEKDRQHREERNADQNRWDAEREKRDKEYREERQDAQDRWATERSELLNYISIRDANWLTYTEKRDDLFERQMREWSEVMIRVEALLLKNNSNGQ